MSHWPGANLALCAQLGIPGRLHVSLAAARRTGRVAYWRVSDQIEEDRQTDSPRILIFCAPNCLSGSLMFVCLDGMLPPLKGGALNGRISSSGWRPMSRCKRRRHNCSRRHQHYYQHRCCQLPG